MLNFKSATIFLILTISICILLHFFFQINLGWIFLPIVCYTAVIIYGSATIQSDFFIKAFCSSNTSEKIISITFDDGPNAIHTTEILKTLATYNAKATFFIIGKNIKNNETIVKQIDSEGHTIGNHTFSHSFFIDFSSEKKFIEELNQTDDEVYTIIGKRINLFRPPYGVTTPNLAKAAKTMNYKVIGWNVRSLDTTSDSEEKITKRVLEKIKPGVIILFHDTSSKTINVLKQTLNFAKKNGFKVVSVDELLSINKK